MEAASRYRAQVTLLDRVEKRAAFIVEGCALDRTDVRIDAVRARKAERGVRSLFGGRVGLGEHATEQLAVVTHLHSAVTLETTHVNAELFDHLDVRGDVSEAGVIA